MPVIKEYRQNVNAPGPIQRSQVTAEQMGAGIGVATQRLGEAITGLGKSMFKRAEQEETSELTAKTTEKYAQLQVGLTELVKKGGTKEQFEEYEKYASDELDKLGDEYSTPAARQYHAESTASIKAQLYKTSYQAQADLAGAKAVDNYSKVVNSLSSASMSDPSSMALQMELNAKTLDQLVQTGQLPETERIELKRKSDSLIAASTLRGWAKLNPDYAKKKLDSGEFDQLLGAEGKLQAESAIDQAINAKRIEQDRLRQEQERLKKQQQSLTQNDLLKAMVDKKLTTDMIMESNLDAFGSGSKEQFLGMLETANSASHRLKDDGKTMAMLFERIHLPDGDPRKLTDENELNKYFGNGLGITGLNQLRDEIQGRNTIEGEMSSNLKRGIEREAMRSLVKENPMTGLRDPLGNEQYSKFMTWFYIEYKDQRAKGKTDAELLNPESPEYLGKYIVNFKRSTKDQMKAMTNSTKAPTRIPFPNEVEPRKPGEKLSDYQKRTGGTK